jgi:hypothetical protein
MNFKHLLAASFTLSLGTLIIATITGNPILFGIVIGLSVINVAVCLIK